jgi:hypothetical protein
MDIKTEIYGQLCIYVTAIKEVQHGTVPQRIRTTKNIRETAVTWQDHGKYLLGLRRGDSC